MHHAKSLPPIERLNELFRYDAETGQLFRRTRSDGVECAASQSAAHPHVFVDGKNYLLHRICFAIGHQKAPAKQVDHRDGNSRNNRLVNLREASAAENNQNRRIGSRNRSGVKGVHWHSTSRRWVAIITVNRHRHNLGYFRDIADAASALAAARPRLHGAFANDGKRPMSLLA